MKKNIIAVVGLALSLLISGNIFAKDATGCMTLVNTKWTGQVKLTDGHIVPLTAVVTDVIPKGTTAYVLVGTINGKGLSARVGCTEESGKKIAGVDFFAVDGSMIMGFGVSPPDNPTRIFDIEGSWDTLRIDLTDPSKNFFNKR